MAKRDNSATLYEYVKDYILKLIISGKYPPHSQLPTEYEFMDTLNVGRATVRAALAQLEAEGTIYKIQGVGTFVNERSIYYGLEPLLSLSFILKHVGIEDKNKVVEHKKIIVSEGDEDLMSIWPAGTELYYIKRLRCAEGTVLGVEHNYYTPLAFSKLNQKDLESSLAHNLLTNLDTPINKLDCSIKVREASLVDIQEFSLEKPEKIVEITRWMHFEGQEKPVNYVNFTIPSHVLEFPFLG